MEQAEGLERQVDQINHEIYVKVSIINLEKWEDSVELHRQEGREGKERREREREEIYQPFFLSSVLCVLRVSGGGKMPF